jgi:hypothetical protein
MRDRPRVAIELRLPEQNLCGSNDQADRNEERREDRLIAVDRAVSEPAPRLMSERPEHERQEKEQRMQADESRQEETGRMYRAPVWNRL